MSLFEPLKSRIDSLPPFWEGLSMDVLRLDAIHPVVSGNKWFKLRKYLQAAKDLDKKWVVTVGGAWSNHVLATAAACEAFGLKSIGIIRGEAPAVPSITLQDATRYGMELHFISREAFGKKQWPEFVMEDDCYFIPEGGYGRPGAAGAATILDDIDASTYTHIIAAVGTGTMLAGLVSAAADHQEVIGIPVLKNNLELEEAIGTLLPKENNKRFSLIQGYHFGGYAKHTKELLEFMNEWFRLTSIPTDFVYTGKLFYAVKELARKGYFPSQSRILAIHSGGLQGNRSLPKRSLIYEVP